MIALLPCPNCTCPQCNPVSFGNWDPTGQTVTVFNSHPVRYIEVQPQPEVIDLEIESFETLAERRARWSREGARGWRLEGRRRVWVPARGKRVSGPVWAER